MTTYAEEFPGVDEYMKGIMITDFEKLTPKAQAAATTWRKPILEFLSARRDMEEVISKEEVLSVLNFLTDFHTAREEWIAKTFPEKMKAKEELLKIVRLLEGLNLD